MNELTKKILEVLEIEPDVEFKVLNLGNNTQHICRFNSKYNDFETYSNLYSEWTEWEKFITLFMSDVLTIIDKPWKPRVDETYWYVDYDQFIEFIRWSDSTVDFMFWHVGNCFKTPEEAETNKDRIMKLYESDTPLWKKAEDKE